MGTDSNGIARRNRSRSWWQQKTQTERTMIILLVVAALLILALIVALAIVAHKKQIRPEDEICSTPACVESAATLLKTMNQSVDPCDDFYEFVCGKFLSDAVIPDDKLAIGPIEDLKNMLQQQLRTILEEPSPYDSLQPFSLLKTFYSTCLDTSDLDNTTAITQLLNELGGWPVLEGNRWDERTFDWKNFVNKLRRHGLSINNFIKIEVKPDMNNAAEYAIYIDQAESDVDKSVLEGGLEEPNVKAYSNYMTDLAELFGAEKMIAENDVKQMMEFRILLANISLSTAERFDEALLYHPMTVRELQKRYPSIYWLEYLNRVVDIPNFSVTSEQKVSVNVPQYLNKVGYLLERTSKRVLANHAIFEAVNSLILYLPSTVRDRKQQFDAIMFGVTSPPPRWQNCIEKTTEAFPIAAGALYVRKYFEEETKQVAVDMVTELKNAFFKILQETKWMDEPTKKIAKDKATKLVSHVGYPDEFLDDKKLEEYYSDLHFSSENIIDVATKIRLFKTNTDMRKLEGPVNKTDWRTRYPTVDINAICEPVENSITLPASFLQGAVFDKNRLHSLNYGNMGFFIGHEITHGFDNQGRKYDKNGNLVNWWAEETNKQYLEKTKCIIDQYSKYVEPQLGVNINGIITQGENIADNGGVKEAYMAYNDWVEHNGPEPKLPGLNYTAKQLFWISAASTWCTKEKEAYTRLVLNDVHAPGRFRVIGSFSNFDYFASDFQCPVGSKMNPEHKCQVW